MKSTLKNLIFTAILAVAVSFAADSMAQSPFPPPGGTGGGGPIEPPASGVPIDGGISALLVAGAAYGVKKFRDHKNKK